MKDYRIHFKETKYGFEFGAASIQRVASFPDGSVIIVILAKKQRLEVRVTKSGLIRVSPVVKFPSRKE